MNMKELDFSSPRELGAAITTLLEPQASEKIYDGAFGGLSFLLAIKDYIDRRDEKNSNNSNNIFGKEINTDTYQQAIEKAKKHNININNLINENTLKQVSESVQKYDVVISCPPFGLKTENDFGELGIKTNDGVNKFIQHYINSLVNGGRAAIVVANSFLFSNSKASIELRKCIVENCNLHTVLGLPSKTFSYAGVTTSVLFFIKGEPTKQIKYYSKELDENYSEFIDFTVNNIKNERSFVFSVEKIDDKTFALPDANRLAIENEVKEKTKNFETFDCYKIENVCLEINLTKEKFEEKENSLYLPKIGKSPSVTDIDKTTIKHKNYFQLVFDSEKILNGYMEYYLRSSLGRMILKSCYVGSAIQNITKSSLLENFEVYAPDLKEQKLISSTFQTLADVVSLMEETALELSSDPNSAKHILDKLFHTKEVFDELSIEEKVIKKIKVGENLKVEFKETLSKNIYTDKKDQNLQISVLKNIVGFLNKEGGQLLIGVSDNGEIKGIERDFYKNDDAYKLLLSNLINDKIETKESSYIKLHIHMIKDKKICLIECSKAPNPAYLDGDFYIRTDPECRKLSAKEANEYIRVNFK